MTMHKTDRNIVEAQRHGDHVLDVTFGPSDDDFHHNQHHATISHDSPQPGSYRKLAVKLIFQGNGVEVQWMTGERADSGGTSLDGSVNLSQDGTLGFPFWTGDEDQEVPIWVELKGNVLRVHAFEGDPGDTDEHLIFDSSKLDKDRAS